MQERERISPHGRRWLVWLIPALLYATSHIHRIAPTILFDDLMAAFRTTGASLGGLGSMYFYIYAVMQIPSGLLADSLGPQKTITAGALIGGLGSLVFGSAPNLAMAYLGRFMIGLGVSLIFICIMKLTAEWFQDHEFATMSGLTLFSGNLGSIFATTPLYAMVVAIGWRSAYHMIGLGTLALAAMAWLLVRDRPTASAASPETTAVNSRPKFRVLQALAETLSNKQIWPLVALSFGLYGTLVALKGMWLTPWLTQVYGISREQAAQYVLISLLAALIGPLMMGMLSDRIRRRKLPILIFVPLYVLTWLALSLWNGGRPPLAAVPVLLFMLGIFCSPMAITWACAKEVSRPSLVGLATGIANIGGFLGGAVMQYVFGYILDRHWQGAMADGVRIYPVQAYQAAFLAAALVAAVSLVCSLFIRETHCRNIYTDLNG
jgi:sugar phosphate permease